MGVNSVSKIFPETKRENYIDREILGKIVFSDKEKLKLLESIIHPLVRNAEKQFLVKYKDDLAVVLEIPLLFEKGSVTKCDFILVTHAPDELRQKRAMARSGMTNEKYQFINKLQISVDEKIKRADFVIYTDKTENEIMTQIINFKNKHLL